ncbi:D-isomer-specific 2-hydroxyacid dehydrogenase NAD-binding protein [Gloeophyllum trabeum ATCC 11539]|uniref:D-isomer-specific 2-hydroxyacid dehydrogenase NAD-binding protein n=1 Tax=Gloeophyllum trabeum (strain ATCC 11539 / FP-39264 / Madison 617) TaxID=670483 RepID=S7S422_GLOTA|nr:D-isomer-specific 2-hydroxyacid dehydrogenase NAD-binding protein [Gloeophyllum trabeum ATCC 11539]EPQ60599.1 D-isomer-specific 2-hydroxyacid dehydrogenase NAD-binding protein [Gloeophyllum trabeum ATCC 11539]
MSQAPEIRVAILDDYQNVSLTSADWSPVQGRCIIDVYRDTLSSEDDLVRRLEPYQVICAMRERTRFPASLLDRLPDLKLIATTGPFNAAIDVGHARSKSILVSGTSGKGNSTLEHIWTLILASARYLVQEDANIKKQARQWQSYIPLGLAGRTLGLVGVGRLGSATAKIAKAFEMRVIGWSPHLTPERAAQAGVEFVASKEELFRQSDVVSVHMVLSDATRHLVTESDLQSMKPTAFFINTSRGPLVDEVALVRVLQQRKIAGAGLDVYEVEPLPQDHPLRTLENVTLTPHTGYVSDTMYEVSTQ